MTWIVFSWWLWWLLFLLLWQPIHIVVARVVEWCRMVETDKTLCRKESTVGLVCTGLVDDDDVGYGIRMMRRTFCCYDVMECGGGCRHCHYRWNIIFIFFHHGSPVVGLTTLLWCSSINFICWKLEPNILFAWRWKLCGVRLRHWLQWWIWFHSCHILSFLDCKVKDGGSIGFITFLEKAGETISASGLALYTYGDIATGTSTNTLSAMPRLVSCSIVPIVCCHWQNDKAVTKDS